MNVGELLHHIWKAVQLNTEICRLPEEAFLSVIKF